MNAGAALMICGSASSLAEGFRQAASSIDSGAAFRRLQLLREMSV
jgi:anthranilate phosphoribosyltransferase